MTLAEGQHVYFVRDGLPANTLICGARYNPGTATVDIFLSGVGLPECIEGDICGEVRPTIEDFR